MNESQLRKMIVKIDEELRSEKKFSPIGIELKVLRRLAMELNQDIDSRSYIAKKTYEIVNELYDLKDTALPPLVVGGFLFKDAVYRLYIGLIFGNVTIDLYDLASDLPEMRKSQLFSSEHDLRIFIDQVCDLIDFGSGLDELKHSSKKNSIELISAGKSQFESAVKAAIENSDKEASMHSCFLAAELIMKGLLKINGKTESELKKLNHNLSKISAEFSKYCSDVNLAALEKGINYLPKSVNERYEVKKYTINDVGKAIMAVQYIAGLTIRSLTNRDLRKTLKLKGKSIDLTRTFPS